MPTLLADLAPTLTLTQHRGRASSLKSSTALAQRLTCVQTLQYGGQPLNRVFTLARMSHGHRVKLWRSGLIGVLLKSR